MGNDFNAIEINGALGRQNLSLFSLWQSNLANWLENIHSIKWNDMQYADVLGFYINTALRNHYGSYEAQALLHRIFLVRHACRDREIVAIVDRLNELDIFKGVPKRSAEIFADKFARYTSACFPWMVHQEGNYYRLSHHSLYDEIDIEFRKYIAKEVDERFVLKLPAYQ